MRLLFDANLSPEVARRLQTAGHDTAHVADIGLLSAPDSVILQAAADQDRILVTADADFGALLAANMTAIAGELQAGAIASLSRDHLRIRPLPI